MTDAARIDPQVLWCVYHSLLERNTEVVVGAGARSVATLDDRQIWRPTGRSAEAGISARTAVAADLPAGVEYRVGDFTRLVVVKLYRADRESERFVAYGPGDVCQPMPDDRVDFGWVTLPADCGVCQQREPAQRLIGLLYRLVCGSSANAGGTPRYKAFPVQVIPEWRPVAAALELWGLARQVAPDTVEATGAGVHWIAADLRLRGIELVPQWARS